MIDRPRVVKLIETGALAPLCIVRAPRSFGKSIALQQWAAMTTRQTVWLVLDKGHSNIEVFWQQLLLAIGTQLVPDTVASHAVELPKKHEDLADPVLDVAAAVAATGPLTVIVENFHYVQHPTVEKDLAHLLGIATELSIVLSSQAVLAMETVQLSLSFDVAVIGAEELVFSAEEAAQFHRGTAIETISNELNEYFQGVPLTHRAAKQVANDPPTAGIALIDHIIDRVTDVVRLEIIELQDHIFPPITLRLLSATLPLVHFDVSLAQTLVPEQGIEDAVARLWEYGALNSASTSLGTQYSYRSIFKDAASSTLAPELQGERARILASAASFEREREEFSPAFAYAMANKDYRFGTQILLESGFKLFGDSSKVMSRTLPQIPKTQLVKYPVLTLALGVIYNGEKHSRFKGLEHFALALAATSILGKSMPPEERLAISLARTVALRLTGQFKHAASAAQLALKNLDELPLADRDKLQIFETIALGQWGLTLLLTGDFSAAEKALQHAIASGKRLGSRQGQYFALSLLAYRHALEGDLHTATTYAELASDSFVEAPSMELYQQTPLAMARAMIELGRLRPEAASKYLAPVLSETATSEFWGRLRVIEAQIDLLQGHPGIATGRLDVALARRKDLPPLNPRDSTALAVMQANLLLTGGNVSGARAALNKLPARNPATIIAKARLSLVTGLPTEVVELLGTKVPLATVMQQLEARILLTVARLQLQDVASVRADLEMISGALTTLQNRWPLVLLTAPDRELLRASMKKLGVPFPPASEMPLGAIPTKLTSITLTPRESTILATLVVTGDRAEIARLNFVTLNTVKSQLRSLYKKLGVTSRDEALLVAHQENLLG